MLELMAACIERNMKGLTNEFSRRLRRSAATKC